MPVLEAEPEQEDSEEAPHLPLSVHQVVHGVQLECLHKDVVEEDERTFDGAACGEASTGWPNILRTSESKDEEDVEESSEHVSLFTSSRTSPHASSFSFFCH